MNLIVKYYQITGDYKVQYGYYGVYVLKILKYLYLRLNKYLPKLKIQFYKIK